MGANKGLLGKTKFIVASGQTLKSEFGEDTPFEMRCRVKKRKYNWVNHYTFICNFFPTFLFAR
jgi:hypothetical protein